MGSLCPLNSSNPVEAFLMIPIAPSDVAGISSTAHTIPDLEGFIRLQIFSNTTRSEIGCFQATLTNGNTFSHPEMVGPILGFFGMVAVFASFATAIYGLRSPYMRMHYAHSFPVMVLFETYQCVFFTGAMSVDWPSILPAWWSNFAWSAGMIATKSMIHSMKTFIGMNDDATQVDGARFVPINDDGGLWFLQKTYGSSALSSRAEYNSSNPYDYNWNGHPRTPGMPMPGFFPGFAGTLSAVNIPEKDACMIGLIWLLVMMAAVFLFVVMSKVLMEISYAIRLLTTNGYDYFRGHWMQYSIAGLMRALYTAFFAVMTLTMHQFAIHDAPGPTALAALVWLFFLVGIGGFAAYACFTRLRHGRYELSRDEVQLRWKKIFDRIPYPSLTRNSALGIERGYPHRLFGSVPFFRVEYTDSDPFRTTVHQDRTYIKRYGWLSSRYRRTRWWFFAVHLGYQFIRACFLGAASRVPLFQVVGLFFFEVIASIAMIKMDPFEGRRNMVMAIWLQSICKVVTTGLAIPLLPQVGLNRAAATILGIFIIVLQAFLIVGVVVLVNVGTVSTWMSLTRNQQRFHKKLENSRIRYFEHVERRARDLPPGVEEDVAAEAPRFPPPSQFVARPIRRVKTIASAYRQFGSTEVLPGPVVPTRREMSDSVRPAAYLASKTYLDGKNCPTFSEHQAGLWDFEMEPEERVRWGFKGDPSPRMIPVVRDDIVRQMDEEESAELPSFLRPAAAAAATQGESSRAAEIHVIESQAAESTSPENAVTQTHEEALKEARAGKKKSVSFDSQPIEYRYPALGDDSETDEGSTGS